MTTSNFSVRKYAHTGITVASLTKALDFWHGLLGAQIKYRHHIETSPENNTVGVPDAVMDIALLSLPDGTSLELLEYLSPADRKTYKPRPCDVGNVHVALEVRGSQALIEQAAVLGWKATGKQAKVKRGDGSHWGITYVHGPDGETVELLEPLEE